MPSLRVTLDAFSEVLGTSSRSTFLIACMMDLNQAEEVIDVKIFKTGQGALDFFHQLDRPGTEHVIVGLQLAVPASISGNKGWKVESVLDFKRCLLETSNHPLDVYAYQTLSGQLFSDERKIERSQIVNARSIYKSSNADTDDNELMLFQSWLSTILEKLIVETYALKSVRDHHEK